MSIKVSRLPHAIPPKRSFADFDEPGGPSSLQPGTSKRLRIDTEEATKEAKTVQQRQQQQQQPKPLPLKRLYVSFLEDSVDPLPSSPTSKRYRTESVDSFVTQWLESILESESHRERHCRSDTLLSHSDGDFIPRRLTKSAPNTEHRRDDEGYVLPAIAVSTRSSSYLEDAEDDLRRYSYAPSVGASAVSGASTGSSRKRSLVEDPLYRVANLAANNIYMRFTYEEFPEDIARLVDHVRKGRDSPGPSPDQLRQDFNLHRLEMGTGESDVEKYFHTNVFPDPEFLDSLQRTDRNPMAKHAVPDFGSNLKVSTPIPHTLYGYSRLEAFTKEQQAQFNPMGNEMVANSQDLVYPFFVIEFKADGPSGSGSLWVATNQCLGGSASCINLTERLNSRLRCYESDKVRLIESASFSIAMSGTEARLYVSWTHELKYYMAKVDSFLLQEPTHYIKFRKYVRNILDWGKDKRLNDIRDSLNGLLEESRKMASQLSKPCPPPSSDDSTSSSRQKRRSGGLANATAKPTA